MARAFLVLGLVGMFMAIAVLRPGGGPGLAYAADCNSYGTQQIAQAVLRALPTDLDGLDGSDDDGIACSELPCPCDTDAVEHVIGDVPTATPTPISTATPTATLMPSPGQQATARETAQASAIASATTAAASTATPPAAATEVSRAATHGLITPPSTGGAGLR